MLKDSADLPLSPELQAEHAAETLRAMFIEYSSKYDWYRYITVIAKPAPNKEDGMMIELRLTEQNKINHGFARLLLELVERLCPKGTVEYGERWNGSGPIISYRLMHAEQPCMEEHFRKLKPPRANRNPTADDHRSRISSNGHGSKTELN